jgi:transposase
MKRRYEIRDDQWDRIKDMLPAERKPQGGRPAKDNRKMLNAMLWVACSGAPWRDLPDYYGPWNRVYTRFRRWEKAGLFSQILEYLWAEPEFSETPIGGCIKNVTQSSACLTSSSSIADWRLTMTN